MGSEVERTVEFQNDFALLYSRVETSHMVRDPRTLSVEGENLLESLSVERGGTFDSCFIDPFFSTETEVETLQHLNAAQPTPVFEVLERMTGRVRETISLDNLSPAEKVVLSKNSAREEELPILVATGVLERMYKDGYMELEDSPYGEVRILYQ